MSFSKTEEGYVIEVPEEGHMGPAMRRLNERQRKFVCALAVYGGDQTRAYLWAGYGSTNERSAQAASSRLSNSDDIKEAIREEAWRRLDYSSLLAISTMVELAGPSNPDRANRLKAADMLSKRTGFHEKSEMLVVHEDRRTTKELMDFIRSRAPAHGLDPDQLLGTRKLIADTAGPVIDAEFEEVPEELKGLV